jgi:hypothetical protein
MYSAVADAVAQRQPSQRKEFRLVGERHQASLSRYNGFILGVELAALA